MSFLDHISTATWVVITICSSAVLVQVLELIRNRRDKRKGKKQ